MSTRHSGEARQDHDFYVDPEWCTQLLLDAENFSGNVWDPACGQGSILNACMQNGIKATGSDLVDRGCGHTPVDFLKQREHRPMVSPVGNIICNPPFKQAEAFIRQALELVGPPPRWWGSRRTAKVAMLVQEKFLFSQRRHALFKDHPPAAIYFLSTRPSMPPGHLLARGAVKAAGGSVNYCWIVWQRGYRGPPTCGWLIKEG
jgi:hypothetical protein